MTASGAILSGHSGNVRAASRPREPKSARARWGGGAGPRRAARLLGGGLLIVVLVAGIAALAGCRATKPDSPSTGALTIDLTVVPQILPADTTKRATVWVTVLQGGEPVPDSTRVWLVATSGTIPAEAFTTDGLATTSYRPGLSTGIVTLIAQVRGVRDTMNLTVF